MSNARQATWPRVWALVRKGLHRYFIQAMSSMALGLFSSLIIGLILSQLSQLHLLAWLAPLAEMVASTSPVVGSAIGVSVGWSLSKRPLVVFSSAVTGAIGYAAGGPVGAFLAAVVGAELGNLVAGRTPVDIVLVPIVTIVAGGLVGQFAGEPIGRLMTGLGTLINNATALSPVPMGIVVSTVMGLALTAPISSAAIAISLGLDGLAAGAAAVGCSCQMVGFAVCSYRDNGVGGLVSQGLGTSMLQFGNICRRPQILLAPTLASAILGPVSTAVFGMLNNAMGAGMGTSGLVGQFGAHASMAASFGAWQSVGLILLMHFALPAVLSLAIDRLLRKIGWVRAGDMKLNL